MSQVNRGVIGSRVALWRRADILSLRRIGAAATFVIAAVMSVAGISSTAAAATPPGAPASVTAVAGTNSATVSWQPPTTGDPPTGYVVTALKNGTTPQNAVATPSTTTSIAMTGLIGGQGYSFQVYGFIPTVDGAPTASASVTPSGVTTTYASTVLADGPSVYYRLGESGGVRVADSSGQAHNGTYNGSGVTNGAAGALIGDADTAVGLTGSSYIQSTGDGGVPPGNDARTAEAWVKTTAGNQTILDFGTGGCCNQNYDFNLRVSGSTLVLGLGGGADVTWSAPRAINDGSWHQVAITTDGAQTITTYLDGQSLGAQTVGLVTCQGFVRTTCLLNVGANSFTGTIDEVALYQASLNAGQIGAHFNASGYTRPVASGTPSVTSGANSLTATWAPATASVPAGQPAVQGYVATAYKGGTVAQNAVAVPGTATSATISGLAGVSAYTVQVVGYNQFGYGTAGVSGSTTPSGPATTYASAVLTDSPSLYYRLGDPGGGVTADSSGHANHGTYSGSGVAYGAAGGIVGDPDKAVALSGGGYVLDPSQGGVPVGNAARTAEAWVKTSAGNESILDFGAPGCCSSNNYDFNVRISGSVLALTMGAGDLNWTAPRAINDGSWHQVSITYDGGQTVIAYLDGQSLGAQTASLSTCRGLVPTPCVLNLGGPNAYTGTIDEVALYPSALTPAQITGHFNASGYTRPTAPANPLATAGANSVTVTWGSSTATVPAGQPAVQGYVVTAYKDGTTAQNAVGMPGSANSALISGLAGGSAYTVQVVAYNQFGYGQMGSTASVTPTGGSTTYASTVLADGASVYYRLGDAGASVAADSSGHANHGTYSGTGVAYGAAGGVIGDPDTAVALSNGGNIQDLTQGGVPVGSAPRTAEAWVKTTAGNQSILDFGGGGCCNNNYDFNLHVSGSLLTLSMGGADLNWTAPMAINDGTWRHIAITYDGAQTVSAYVNGQLLSAQTATLATCRGLVQTWCILDVGGPAAFTGTIDEVALYPTALTAGQIATHVSRAGYTGPSAPTGVTAVAGPAGARVSWNPSTGPGISRYSVTPVVAGTPGTPLSVDPRLTSVMVPGLTAGTAYTFNVAASNAWGDSASGSSPAAVTATAPLAAIPTTGSLGVFAGYGDSSHGSTFFPSPWPAGSPNDNAGVLLVNTSASPVTVDSVQIIIGGTNQTAATNLVVPANGNAIALGGDNSDINGGAYCNPSGVIPTVTVTVAGVGTSYQDTGQVLNTAGYDKGECPHGTNEGHAWVPIDGGPTLAEMFGPGDGTKRPTSCSCTKSPVDTATGNFWHSFTDFSIPGRGVPLVHSRTYNSEAAPYDGPFGYGWSGSYAMYLTEDPANAAVTVHQAAGSAVTFSAAGSVYLAPGRVLATLVRNADGSFTFTQSDQLHLGFSQRGDLTSEADRNGIKTTLAYANGQLQSVTDPAGRALQFHYTGTRVTSITDGINRTATMTYFPAGDLQKVVDVNGGATQFTYDAGHLMLSMKDPNCSSDTNCLGVRNTLDSSGRVTQQIDAANRTTTIDYSTPGQTMVTDPKGNVTKLLFQSNRLTSKTLGFGTALAATWTYTYDFPTDGLKVATDPNGHPTTRTYDARGNILTVTDALNRPATVNTYDAFNDLTSTTDPTGVTTTLGYDAAGNLTSRSRPLTNSSPAQTQTTTYAHDDGAHAGDVTRAIDPDNKTTTFTYDTYGDVAGVKDPLNNTQTFMYNSVGWRTSSVSPKGNVSGCNCAAQYTTTYSYLDPSNGATNQFGDVRTTTDPVGHTVVKGYDANRQVVSIKDGDGKTTGYKYDAAGEQTDVQRLDTTTLHTDYNLDGTVKDQVDGAGKMTSYGYDSVGRVNSVTDPLLRPTLVTYDGAGNRLTLKDPQLQLTTFGYDADNEVTGITYSDGVTPNVSNLTYDGNGQRKTMTDATGTSSWNYDSLNRMTSSTDGAGHTVGYSYRLGTGYELKSQITGITYPNGSAVTNGYDAAGHLQTVQDWVGHITTFGYDPNSNPTTETLPAATGVVDTSSFDNADRLNGISDARSGTPFAAFTYARDNAGQLTSTTGTGAGQTPEYDAYTQLNQLCMVSGTTSPTCTTGTTKYGYDTADNPTVVKGATQTFDVANQLCWSGTGTGACVAPPSGATRYAYDSRGNRTTLTPPKGSVKAYAYDQADRLKSAPNAAYTYNGDGLRATKTVSGTTQSFAWDVARGLPLLLQDGTAAAPTSYVYGPGGLPLEQITGTTVYYYHHDQLGSTRVLTTSTGTTANTYSYDAFGNLKTSTGSVTNPFRFAGQYTDSETGFQYLRARYYDPATAEFISRDPMVMVTRSAYGYVDGNPLNRLDPTGLLDLPFGLCARNPFGGDNGNGDCATHLSTTQGGLLLGAVGTIASGGALALPEGAAGAAALGWTGVVSGGLAAGADIGPCRQGNKEACFAAGLGLFGTGGGAASLLRWGGPSVAAFVAGSSFVAGGSGLAADLGSVLGEWYPCKLWQ